MAEIPTTGAIAEYHGKRLHIVFSGDDWVAVQPEAGVDIPDAFACGESPTGYGHRRSWVKIPRSVLDGIVHIRSRGKLRGHTVSLQQQLPDGRVGVEFIGDPAVARALGLSGDQYMGWSGLFGPEEFEDIEVEETRRA